MTSTMCKSSRMQNLVSTAEAAALLDVDPATVTRMAKDGRLSFHKNPGATGAYVFDQADVERLRDERSGQEQEAVSG